MRRQITRAFRLARTLSVRPEGTSLSEVDGRTLPPFTDAIDNSPAHFERD